MKIGLLSTFPPTKGGIAIYSDNLANSIKNEVIRIGNLQSKADYKLNFKSLSLKKELEKIISKEKIDLLHIQYIATFFGKYNLNYSLLNTLKLKIPIITTLHEVQYSNKGLKNKILKAIEKKIILRSDAVIVHTPNQKEFLEKKYSRKNIHCIFMGIHPYNINRKRGKNILFFGMISPGKGIEFLIRAMKFLKGFKLQIAGGVPKGISKEYGKKLIQEISKQSFESLSNDKFDKTVKANNPNINISLGWIPENKKAEYYKKADLVVLPYVWAPYQSAVLHDAFSYGLPVVVTRTGAVWEVVKSFGCGEVVRPKSPIAIAEGIKKVFQNYNSYVKGVIKYRKAADWKQIGKETLEVYKESLD